MYYIIGYRKKVTFGNLSKCFPEKDKKEIKRLSKAFYRRNLTHIFVESLKGFTMTQKQFQKRYKIVNPEFLDEYYEKGQEVIALASHYGNWEWGIQAVDSQIKHQGAALYKPLNNTFVENYSIKLRQKFGMKLVSIFDTLDYFQSKKEKPALYIMAADQYPGGMMKKAIWVDFLGIETPCLHGPESYSRYNNLPIIFFDVRRVKKGHYELELKKLADNPNDLEPGEITQRYMTALEEVIREKPEYWLWSHKRWKKKRKKKVENK